MESYFYYLEEGKEYREYPFSIFEKLLKHFPEHITKDTVSTIIEMTAADPFTSKIELRKPALDVLTVTFDKFPHFIDAMVPTFIYKFSKLTSSLYTGFQECRDLRHYQEPELEKAFIVALKKRPNPVLLHLNKSLTNNKDPNLQQGALFACGVMGKRARKYRDDCHRAVDTLWAIFNKIESEYQDKILFTYARVLNKAPHLTDRKKFPLLFEYLTGSNKLLAQMAYYTLAIVLEKGSEEIKTELKEMVEKGLEEIQGFGSQLDHKEMTGKVLFAQHQYQSAKNEFELAFKMANEINDKKMQGILKNYIKMCDGELSRELLRKGDYQQFFKSLGGKG